MAARVAATAAGSLTLSAAGSKPAVPGPTPADEEVLRRAPFVDMSRQVELSVGVRFAKSHSGGGSAFTAHVVPPKVDPSEDEAGGAELLERGMVLYAHRAEPECDSPSLLEAEWSGVVEMPLPELVRDEFEYIAFPPGSDFDMYVLSKTKSA